VGFGLELGSGTGPETLPPPHAAMLRIRQHPNIVTQMRARTRF
jgi:hypothetical protein